MDALTSHCVKLYLAGRHHGGSAGAALRCRDAVLLRPEFRFASRPLKVADSGLLRLSSSKLSRPFCFASSSSDTEVDLETCENLAEETVPSKTAQVRFLLKKECLFGEQFLLVGDHPLLGSWDPSRAIPMNWSEGNVWILDTDVPIGKKIQFKFILRDDSTESENIEWQPDPDRTIQIWETSNAITICEDWEFDIRQKIIEAETFIGFIEEVTDDGAKTLVEEENLFPDSVAYTAYGSAVDTASMEVPSFPDVIMNPNLVADNISDPIIEQLQFESDVSATQNTMEENLVSSEGPVLVPGLSQFPMAVSEDQEGPFHFEEEGTFQFEQEESSTVDELENIVADPKEVELDDAARKEGAATLLMVDNEEEQQKINGRTQFGLEEEMSSKEVKHQGVAEVNVVLNSDIEWGRKALQGFLTNLGLLLQ